MFPIQLFITAFTDNQVCLSKSVKLFLKSQPNISCRICGSWKTPSLILTSLSLGNFLFKRRKPSPFLCIAKTKFLRAPKHTRHSGSFLEKTPTMIKSCQPPGITSVCHRSIWKRRNPFSWWQCIISHIEHFTGKKVWIGFRIASASTVFFRPDPATIICPQTSRDNCVVGVLSWTKKLYGKQKGILEGLANHIILKA